MSFLSCLYNLCLYRCKFSHNLLSWFIFLSSTVKPNIRYFIFRDFDFYPEYFLVCIFQFFHFLCIFYQFILYYLFHSSTPCPFLIFGDHLYPSIIGGWPLVWNIDRANNGHYGHMIGNENIEVICVICYVCLDIKERKFVPI